jgi:hypothetical protein
MKKRHLKNTVFAVLCVLTLCIFVGHSYSADTVISVLSEPGDLLGDADAEASDRENLNIFGLSEPEDLLETTSNQPIHPNYFPPSFLDVIINGKYGALEVIEVTDKIKVEISYAFNDASSGYTLQGERFVVVKTPRGEWYSISNSNGVVKVVKGIQGEPFTVTEGRTNEVVLNTSILGMPLGAYTFYLAFDESLNGVVDYNSLIHAKAVAQLRNPLKVSLSASPISGPSPLEVTYQVTVKDPQDIKETCMLILEDGEFPCGVSNTHIFTEKGSHAARAEVKDIYDRSVLSDIVTITVDPPAQNQRPTVSNLTVTPSAVYSDDESFIINYYYSDPDGLDDVKKHHIGIGTASFSYAAGGDGQFRDYFNFAQTSTPGDHYIDVYVVDSAGNSSNTLSSSVYFGGGGKPCGTFTEAGSDTEETHYVELGKTSGPFWFEYETYNQEDRITIWYEDRPTPIFDSKCVGTNGTRSTQVSYSGNSTKVMVHVEPNCFGGSGTKWNFTVRCPL